MIYRVHYGGALGIQTPFAIVIDDEKSTWISDPPGHDIATPMAGVRCAAEGGALGSSRLFDIFPAGIARESK